MLEESSVFTREILETSAEDMKAKLKESVVDENEKLFISSE